MSSPTAPRASSCPQPLAEPPLPARRPRPRETDKELAEAVALLNLLKHWNRAPKGRRGQFHAPDERRRMLELAGEALRSGARLVAISEVLGVSARTLQRWRKPEFAQDGRSRPRPPPPNRLLEDERKRARELLHTAAERGLSPRKLVPWLADQGLYVASESTFYRLRRAEAGETGKALPTRMAPAPRPRQLITAPNQAWSWDITYLKHLQGPADSSFLYLYLVMDVFSRRIMGWQIHLEETAEHASQLILRTCEENNIASEGLVLCSDNGRPMRGVALQQTLRRLGIRPSYSRPWVSNDNPWPEALFRTLKSRPDTPRGGFASPEEARAWVKRFVRWYNREHLHSGLQFITPDDRYFGREALLLAQRRRVYEQAWAARPERWSRPPRRWEPSASPQLFTKTPAPDRAWLPALRWPESTAPARKESCPSWGGSTS